MKKTLRIISMLILSMGAFSATHEIGFVRSGSRSPSLKERLESVTQSRPDLDAGIRWRQRIEVRSRLRRYASTAEPSPNKLSDWKRAA